MKRREFLRSTLAAASASALFSGCRSGAAVRGSAGEGRRPNVVVVITDDQRWDCLSCAGHPFLKTPNLDRLAAEGARFANAFVTTSLCSPSRASMLSGLYAHTHRIINNFTDYPSSLPSYPVRLHDLGYETAYIGKWHMGEQSDEKRPGFDYWASHKGQGKYFDTTFNINGERKLLKGYYTHRVTDLAVDWIKRPRGRPFCLIVGHKAAHTDFQPEPKYAHVFDDVEIKPPSTIDNIDDKPKWVRDRLETWHGVKGPLFGIKDYATFVRRYLATLLSVDDSVGALYAALKETGELDNTLFIFTSDNGFLLGEHGMTDKRTMNEESIRVPFIVRYPRLIREPRVVEEMVLNIDMAPSIVDICTDGKLPGVQGLSWKSLFTGEPVKWRTSWLYEYNYEKEFPYTPNVRGVRTDEWKYVHYPNGTGLTDTYKAELYNLKADPLETHNLIDDPSAAKKLEELKNELRRLLAETGALPDRMPRNPVIRKELPEESIR